MTFRGSNAYAIVLPTFEVTEYACRTASMIPNEKTLLTPQPRAYGRRKAVMNRSARVIDLGPPRAESFVGASSRFDPASGVPAMYRLRRGTPGMNVSSRPLLIAPLHARARV